MQNDLDPDNNFYTKILNSCEYFTEDHFEAQMTLRDSLSIIHFNCRSLNSNFPKILDCLELEIEKLKN